MIDRNPDKIKEIFNSLAQVYDRNNDIISLFTHRIIKHQAVGLLHNVSKNAKILDICTGTGDLAGILAKKFPNATIIGGDFSVSMLNLARKKHPEIDFIQADCLNLPFKNETFDIVSAGFGLRNTADYDLALREISRVLKKGGTFLHLDFGEKRGIADCFFKHIVRLTGEFQNSQSYEYLLKSREEFPEPEELIKLFNSHGLELQAQKSWLLGTISTQIVRKN